MRLIMALVCVMLCVGCQAPENGGIAGVYTAQLLFIFACLAAGFGLNLARIRGWPGYLMVILAAALFFFA